MDGILRQLIAARANLRLAYGADVVATPSCDEGATAHQANGVGPPTSAKLAAIDPTPGGTESCIARPRSRTNRIASSNCRAPTATNARHRVPLSFTPFVPVSLFFCGQRDPIAAAPQTQHPPPRPATANTADYPERTAQRAARGSTNAGSDHFFAGSTGGG